MVDAGIIEPSRCEWASSIVLVKKRDGGLRLYVDYRQLNAVTPVDAFSLPRIDDLIDKLGGAKFIRTLDLSRGYWQVPVCCGKRSTKDNLYHSYRSVPWPDPSHALRLEWSPSDIPADDGPPPARDGGLRWWCTVKAGRNTVPTSGRC